MRRFLALLAVAAIGAVMYVAAAPGSLQATGPTARQFAALKKQVAGLGNTVKTLNGQVGTLKAQLSALAADEAAVKTLGTNDDAFIHNCLIAGHAIGVSRFGDPTNGTFGYAYQDSTGSFLTSALDADSSSTPSAFFQAVAASCVSSGNAAARNGVPSEGRASTLATAKH
jgi:hypothetical protein